MDADTSSIKYRFKDRKSQFYNTKKKNAKNYKLSDRDIEYVKFLYNKLNNIQNKNSYEKTDKSIPENNFYINNYDDDFFIKENDRKNESTNIMHDCIDLIESQIDELYQKQEELYSLIHTQQQQIEKLTADIKNNN